MHFSPPDFNISVVCILRCLYFSLVPVCETWCSALCALARKPNKVKQHLLHLKSSHQTIHAQFHASDDMKSFSFLQTRAKWGGNIEGKLLFWGDQQVFMSISALDVFMSISALEREGSVIFANVNAEVISALSVWRSNLNSFHQI